jgi:hypothetical protein
MIFETKKFLKKTPEILAIGGKWRDTKPVLTEEH